MDVVSSKSGRLASRRNRWIVAGALAVLACAVAVLLNLGEAVPSISRENLWLDTAVKGDMVREVRANGVLAPRDVRWATADVVGTVQEILIQPGSQVAADDIIIRLTNPAAAANLANAQAVRTGAEADLASRASELRLKLLEQDAAVANAEANFKVSQVNTTAIRHAYERGVISRIDAEQAEITMAQNERLWRLALQQRDAYASSVGMQQGAAQAKLDQALNQLSIAEDAAASLNVRAGIDGILQQVNVEPGQQVALGASLARVARPEPLVARLLVPELQARELKAGLPVRVDTRNGVVEGTVTQVDPAVRNGSVSVDVGLPSALPAGTRPDLSIEGRVVLDNLLDVISIARPAVAAPNGNGSLFVVQPGSNVAERVSVVYGPASTDRIVVVSGIEPGQQVILSDASRWSDYPSLNLK